MSKRIKIAKYPGVYYRESPTRRHDGKPDRCFDVTYRDQRTGKFVWEKVGWASEGYSAQYAANVRGERIRSIRHGDILPQKRREPTFADIWAKYDEWLESGRKRPSVDRGRYHNHIRPELGDRQLSRLSPLDIERLKSKLDKKGLSAQTVKHCLALVRAIINKAVIWGLWTGDNPVKRVRMPKVDNERKRFLTPEEARTLLDALAEHSEQVHDYALLSLHTGMRADEIFSLAWEDVDLTNRLIHVHGKMGFKRIAHMTDQAHAMLSQRATSSTEGYVFPARDEEKTQWVSKTYQRIADELFNQDIRDSLNKVVFHTLRHTFASWLAMSGTPILTIKELMGHHSLAMTLRYAKLSPDYAREAVKSVEKMAG